MLPSSLQSISSCIEDSCRRLYQRFADYKALHLNTIPQQINHVLILMAFSNVSFLIHAIKIYHRHVPDFMGMGFISLLISVLSLIHNVCFWYFLNPSSPSSPSSSYASVHSNTNNPILFMDSSIYLQQQRYQGQLILFPLNEWTLGISIGFTFGLILLLFILAVYYRQWYLYEQTTASDFLAALGSIGFQSSFLCTLNSLLIILLAKGKDDVLAIANHQRILQYQNISDDDNMDNNLNDHQGITRL